MGQEGRAGSPLPAAARTECAPYRPRLTRSPAVVVFDLGKVLVDYDYSIASRRTLRRTRLAFAEMQRLLCASPLLRQYETGAITTAQFHQAVCAA